MSDHVPRLKPLELFESKKCVNICAPMVRYSKLAFRSLVRNYDCDLAYTPMIISNSFNRSCKARDSEFTTNSNDQPLIAQFAANNAKDFADSAEILYSYTNGVDLNCGCPQRWAMCEGYGACMLKHPELLRDIVSQTRNRLRDPDFTISIKIRILEDMKKTVTLCQTAEKAGLSWLTVHGRTAEQRSEPVNLDAIKIITSSLSVPVVANGDITHLRDVKKIQEETGVKGVMCARGILANPTMFTGTDFTPFSCVKKWISTSLTLGTPFTCFHHHLMFMLEHVLPKSERKVFNSLTSTAAVIDHLQCYFQEPLYEEKSSYL